MRIVGSLRHMVGTCQRLTKSCSFLPKEEGYLSFSSLRDPSEGQKFASTLDDPNALRGWRGNGSSKRPLADPTFLDRSERFWSEVGWVKDMGLRQQKPSRVPSSIPVPPVVPSGVDPVRVAVCSSSDSVSWRKLCEDGEVYKAFEAVNLMAEEGTFITREMIYCLIKGCIAQKNLPVGRRVHDLTVRRGYETNTFLANHLVRMYATLGSLQEADDVFMKLAAPTAFVWTSIISAHAEQGQAEHAIKLYERMRKSDLRADSYLYVTVLKACTMAIDLISGQLVHADVTDNGFESNVFVGSALLNMYAKCGSLEDARRVFDRMSSKNVVTWNTIITGYATQGLGEEALKLFERMREDRITPDKATFLSLLKACTSARAIKEGRQIHAQIVESGLESDGFVGSALMDMYVKCGSLVDARKVFDRLPARDTVTWSAMISGYAQHGLAPEALQLLTSMQEDGTRPDSITFLSILKLCGNTGALQEGKRIYAQLLDSGLDQDLLVKNGLLEMFVKCGSLEDACRVFDAITIKDVTTWNSLITGYAQQGVGQEALTLFARMQQEGMVPNVTTFVNILKACGSVGALQEGKRVHTQVVEKGLLVDLIVANSLVDMYAKCGSLEEAQSVFDGMSKRDVVTWTALINGFGQHNRCDMAMQWFDKMQRQGVVPDAATFLCLLVACSHVGLVDKGQQYFRMMVETYDLIPGVEHYTCMVDLLGRSGRLDEAEQMLETMPFGLNSVGWRCLLSASKTYHNIEVGRRCFDRLVQMEPQHASCYALMTDMYSEAGRWEDVDDIENLRKWAGAEKKFASASIEVNNQVHEFTVGSNRDDTGAKLRSLNQQLTLGGHGPQMDLILESLSEKEKEDALCGHAEKLAVAFGLLNTPEGSTLLVTKNLKMCSHCHSGTKIISSIEKREIIVRDAHRVHHFKEGACSCGDDS